MKDIDITVIIVSYNVCSYIEQCLQSVFSAQAGLSLEIFIVDNASTDGSPETLRRRFPEKEHPELHIIANGRNVGFGRANNQAVAQARGRYVLFLNPDTMLTEHTLRDCFDFATSHPDLGALGVMMLNSNGSFAFESRRGLPTPWTAFCKMSGLSSLFPRSRTFGRYYMRYLDEHLPSEVEIVSGAFMMLPRTALEAHGGFDKRFFMYGEDIDLSHRMQLAGLRNYYLPTPILHYKGESTRKNTFRYVHVFYGAMLLFFQKYYHRASLLLTVPIRTAIFLKATAEYVSGRVRAAIAALRPRRDATPGVQYYVGTHTAQAEALARRHGLVLITRHAGADGITDEEIAAGIPEGCVHVVFDTADFSRERILRFFRTSAHTCHVGTYYPAEDRLITGSYVLD